MKLAGIVAGGVFGGVVGATVGRMLKAAHVAELTWSDLGALVIAAMLAGVGFVAGVLAMSRRGRAILLNPTAPDFHRRPRRGQGRYFLMQAGILWLAGLMLGAPPLFELTLPTHPRLLAASLMTGIGIAFLLQTWLNIRVWMESDEVFRQVTAESGAACFWLFQGLLFLFACAEKLKLVQPASTWDTVTVLMAAYLITSTVVAYRRGLG
jgi:hypothetical protein